MLSRFVDKVSEMYVEYIGPKTYVNYFKNTKILPTTVDGMFEKYFDCFESEETDLDWLIEHASVDRLKSFRRVRTILHVAVDYGHLKGAQQLLSLGISVDILDDHGMTPLYWILGRNSMGGLNREDKHFEGAKFLVESGANINHSLDGETCLFLAGYRVGMLLIDSGCICYNPRMFAAEEYELQETFNLQYYTYKMWLFQLYVYSRLLCDLLLKKQAGPEVLEYLIGELPNPEESNIKYRDPNRSRKIDLVGYDAYKNRNRS